MYMYIGLLLLDSPAGGSSSSIGGVSQQTTPTLVLPAVETVTGEEGERHVTQVINHTYYMLLTYVIILTCHV